MKKTQKNELISYAASTSYSKIARENEFESRETKTDIN